MAMLPAGVGPPHLNVDEAIGRIPLPDERPPPHRHTEPRHLEIDHRAVGERVRPADDAEAERRWGEQDEIRGLGEEREHVGTRPGEPHARLENVVGHADRRYRLLAELLDLGEDLVRLWQLSLAVPLDEADLALLVHDERRPAVGVPLGPVDAVILRDGAVDIREQRIVADTDRLGPVGMTEWAVSADTQHLGIRRLKVADALVEGGHARASARRPVEGIEENDHVLPAKVLEADLFEPDRPEREVGRGVAHVEGLGVTHSLNPPFANLRGVGFVILARGSPARAGGFRVAAHAMLSRLSSGASARPRKVAAVTTRPVSQSRAKRSANLASRSA